MNIEVGLSCTILTADFKIVLDLVRDNMPPAFDLAWSCAHRVEVKYGTHSVGIINLDDGKALCFSLFDYTAPAAEPVADNKKFFHLSKPEIGKEILDVLVGIKNRCDGDVVYASAWVPRAESERRSGSEEQ